MRVHLCFPILAGAVACSDAPLEDTSGGADTSAVDADPIVPASCLARAADAQGTVLYVVADAPEGGDGSPARPFRILQDAMDAADGVSTVLVAPGEYVRGFRATDPRRHAQVTVRGCEAQGAVIKDPVVFAGTDEARLTRVELADLRVTAPVYALNVSDLVLGDLAIDSFFGGTTFERSRVSVLGTVTLTTTETIASACAFVEAEVMIEGALEIEASASIGPNACFGVVTMEDTTVLQDGRLGVVTSGDDLALWDYCPAIVARGTSIVNAGELDVSGVAPVAYLEDAVLVSDDVLRMESSHFGGAILERGHVDVAGEWSLRLADQDYYALMAAESTFTATTAGQIRGDVFVGAGSTRMEGVDIQTSKYAGIKVRGGDLTFAGACSIAGTSDVNWGVYVDDGGTVTTADGAVVDVSGAQEGIFVADGAITMRGLRVHDVASNGVRSAGPLVAEEWEIRDAGDHALYVIGADADVRGSTFERSAGILAQASALRLRDVRVSSSTARGIDVLYGAIDAERVEVTDAPRIGVSLSGSGGRMADVRIQRSERGVVQSSCDARTPSLELVDVTCEECGEPAPMVCGGGTR